jgi:DNA-binding transcriptional regulator YiaG
MKSITTQKTRALREVLGQTQAAFSATIGASKDTVASWETGRNELSATLARRIGTDSHGFCVELNRR